jgi:hypothetical protein
MTRPTIPFPQITSGKLAERGRVRPFSTRPIFCGLEPGVPIVMGLRGCKGPPVTVVHIRLWRLRCLAHVSYDPKSGHFLLTQNGHFCRRSGDLNLGIGQSPRKSG